MQVDTGASLSLMSETTFRELWPQRNLTFSEVRLSGESMTVVGSVDAKVAYKCQSITVPLIVVKGSGLGCNWLQIVRYFS